MPNTRHVLHSLQSGVGTTSHDLTPFCLASAVEEWYTINMEYAHEGHHVHLVV